MKKTIFLSFLLILSINISAQGQNQAYLNYIEKYHEIAELQQREHGIPASITLAQGLLESGAGQSRLTQEANNHFGIKCHNWTGEGYHQDDDAPNECFRKYKSAQDSYEDHSAFLINGKRYASLFELNPTDYEKWAHGLKSAGYATDPSYAYKLISIVETYDLHKYDLNKDAQPKVDAKTKKEIYEKPRVVDYEEFSMGVISPTGRHVILKNNGIRYIVAARGDTYGSIGDEYHISEKKLRRYNEAEDMTLEVGQRVYLGQKKKVAAKGLTVYTVRVGDSMYSISQTYGIRVQALYDLNKMSYTTSAKVGQILNLR
jgi:LysM repeat protein